MGSLAPDPPEPPDFGPIAELSEKQFEMAHELAKRQFQWAKRTYRDNKKLTGKVADIALPAMRAQAQAARQDRRFYLRQYRPLEKDLAREAKEYGKPAFKRAEMGRAEANVAQQFERARMATQRQLESYGVNPGSIRFGALDIGIRAQQAAAQAAAGTEAGRHVDDVRRALRSEAINVGRGYPGAIAGAYTGATTAGNSAVTNANQTYGAGAGAMGTAPQFMGAGNSALNIWGNTLNMGYENQLAAFNAQQGASSGFGSLLGLGLGVGANIFGFDEGGVVPEEASPTRGVNTDDAVIAVTPGEFIVPEDVVRWKGEEFFQKQIDQSREKRRAVPVERKEGAPTVIPGYAGGGVVDRRRRRRRITMRAATFPPNNPNRPDPIPGSHSTVGPLGPLPNAPGITSGVRDLYSDYWSQYYDSPAETLNPSPFYPNPRPGSSAIAIPYDDPRFYAVTPPVTARPPIPRPPVARPPVARPPIPRPPVARPLRPIKRPMPPLPIPRPLTTSGSPYLAAEQGRVSAVDVYGGMGFEGSGGAFTSAANDAFSASGSRPGVGHYSGPNPGPTDPDYGYAG